MERLDKNTNNGNNFKKNSISNQIKLFIFLKLSSLIIVIRISCDRFLFWILFSWKFPSLSEAKIVLLKWNILCFVCITPRKYTAQCFLSPPSIQNIIWIWFSWNFTRLKFLQTKKKYEEKRAKTKNREILNQFANRFVRTHHTVLVACWRDLLSFENLS